MRRVRWLFLPGAILFGLGWLAKDLSTDPLRAAERAYRQGNYAAAAALYGEAVRESADPTHAAFNRGAALYQLGKYPDAALDYQSASDHGRGERQARACYDLGNCMLRQACRSSHDPGTMRTLLEQAIGHYESCLRKTGPADTLNPELAANARYNQELARQLLARLPEPEDADPVGGPPDRRTPDATAGANVVSAEPPPKTTAEPTPKALEDELCPT
jgi:tetratricopeptide (TPR) repeat protein